MDGVVDNVLGNKEKCQTQALKLFENNIFFHRPSHSSQKSKEKNPDKNNKIDMKFLFLLFKSQ